MPMVNGKKFPYTEKGKKMAKKAAAKKIASSAVKPKSKTQRSVEKAARGIVSKTFLDRPGRSITPPDFEAMKKAKKILTTRMMSERSRSAARAKTENVKGRKQDIARARNTARKAVTGR